MFCGGSGQVRAIGEPMVGGGPAAGAGFRATSSGAVIPLRRSRSDRMVAGVVGGLAKRMGMDPTLARVLYVVLSVFSAGFPGLILYVALWMVIPREDDEAAQELR